MRSLIRELAGRATVILSTHIMQEVEALCDRVLVLASGRLALDSPMESLRESRQLLLTCSDEGDALRGLFERMPQIASVEELPAGAGQRSLRLALKEGATMDATCADVSRALLEAGGRLYRLHPAQRDLEQIFRDAVQTAGGRHAA